MGRPGVGCRGSPSAPRGLRSVSPILGYGETVDVRGFSENDIDIMVLQIDPIQLGGGGRICRSI